MFLQITEGERVRDFIAHVPGHEGKEKSNKAIVWPQMMSRIRWENLLGAERKNCRDASVEGVTAPTCLGRLYFLT